VTLTNGTQLGVFEIIGQIGAGGMGEVYRARDSKLGRDVAIKTLPAALADDKDRLARFEREAKLLASLNHAHIASVYNLDEHDGTIYIAMELVEGETLEEKLKSGALSLDGALETGLQIALALEAAHDKGVVHRDLKPANIMITPDAVVKVLDFGLAKAFSGDPDDASPGHSPALSIAMTQQGLILGTAGYMSPEQASGQATDQRADIWAFGVVFYEMLTGQPLFHGESVPHVLADVLRADPDWSRLPRNLHARIRLMLERCLEKKPRDRYHSIADVRVDIQKALSDPSGESDLAAAGGRSRNVLPAIAATALVTAIVAGALAWNLKPAQRETVAPVERYPIAMPSDLPVLLVGYPNRYLELSPDGSQLVYVAMNTLESVLALRSMDSLDVTLLPGTEGARQPFFSPDGQWLAFFTTEGALKKINLAAGGAPVPLASGIEGARWAFGVWIDDDEIVFGSMPSHSGLRRVSSNGGEPTLLTTFDADNEQLGHTTPAYLPASRTILFTSLPGDGSAPRIEAVSLDTDERKVILENAWDAKFLGGNRLLWQQENILLTQPFDAETLSLVGSAISLTDDVRLHRIGEIGPVAQLSVARDGTLAYLPADHTPSQIGLVSRDGTFQPVVGLPRGNYSLPRASSDGATIAYLDRQSQQHDIRVLDLVTGRTAKRGQNGRDIGLAWHPENQSLMIADRILGAFVVSEPGGEASIVDEFPEGFLLARNMSWSGDGSVVAITAQSADQHDIWILTPGDEPKLEPFLDGPENEFSPSFSPDGRLLAYQSDASDRAEVYVKPYPEGRAEQVSIGGGESPVFNPATSELHFFGIEDGVRRFMTASVTFDDLGLEIGTPVASFDLYAEVAPGSIEPYAFALNLGPSFDVMPDGERFIFVTNADDAGGGEIVIVRNWLQNLGDD
jgi:Tol biopolymer transport system component/predicted Ser/Thr protein kinase